MPSFPADPVIALLLSALVIALIVIMLAIKRLFYYRRLFLREEESESRMRAIVETAVDGIITIDCRGIVQAFNPSAERLFGWSADEVIGHNIKMLMPEPDQSQHDGYLANYLNSGVARIIGQGREVTGLHKDGHPVPIRLAVGRVELPGEPLFVGFVSDITERRALESSLREAAERAEQAAAAKGIFLANMSHEIRTPMNAIIGFTELLLGGELSALQRRHLGTVRQSARSLLGLLNDILDTTKLEKGAFRLEQIHFSLQALATQVMASMRLAAEARSLELTVHFPPDLDEYCVGDPLRVQQILTNLVGNAIKFTERGHVGLDFRREDGWLFIEVRDTGIGMSAEQLARIFAPFTQADTSISRRFGGTGLGTTIARQLAELMGGTIEVESEPGRGSVFRVALPLPAGSAPAEKAQGIGTMSLPPLHILVADDVAQNLELLTLIMEQGGHRVTTARNGEEALEQFMAGRFDIVLMDVHMPHMDGLEAVRRLRSCEREQGRVATPVIALTASVQDTDREAAREAGMDGFAMKPLDVPRLLVEMARVLGLQQPFLSPRAARAAVPARTPLPLAVEPAGSARPAPAARTRADPVPSSWPDASPRAVQDAVRTLLGYLARGELDDPSLLAVCEGFRAQGEQERGQALNSAVDAFDFDLAEQLLRDWLARLPSDQAECHS